MDNTVVLLTTAIDPPPGIPYLKMSDAVPRIVATKASVYFWATQGIRHLVIADATGKQVLGQQEIELFHDMGVVVEQLFFEQDAALVKKFGKGYAEGLLVDFAVEHSLLIDAAGFFYKCTGKVFCRNFPEIHRFVTTHQCKVLF